MNTLDPKIRDLLVAIYLALGPSDDPGMAAATVRAAIESSIRWPGPYPLASATAFILNEAGEAADAFRVRHADAVALAQVTGERSA